MQQYLDSQLNRYKLDAMYISNPVNIKYLTGFDGSFGVLIVRPGQKLLVTDKRYLEEARNHCKGVKVLNVLEKEWQDMMHSFTSLSFEESHLTVERFNKLKGKFSGPKWIPSHPVIESMRREKNAFELTAMKRACEIGSQALNEVIENIKAGQTEIEIAWQLGKIARNGGAEGLSFPAIVAFGENSAMPHHKPGQSILKKGDTVLIDFGVLYHGYCSDMTRTFFFQDISSRQEEIYNTVLEAQLIGIKSIQVSKSCIGSYESVVKFFTSKNLQDYFTHSLGHGVGLEVHEAPALSKISHERFRELETVTCEPGLYFPGEFGVRIEDLGVVKKEGYEVYTNGCSKELQVIG